MANAEVQVPAAAVEGVHTRNDERVGNVSCLCSTSREKTLSIDTISTIDSLSFESESPSSAYDSEISEESEDRFFGCSYTDNFTKRTLDRASAPTAICSEIVDEQRRKLKDFQKTAHRPKSKNNLRKRRSLPSSLSFDDILESVTHPSADLLDNSCIIIDFDDTLFPTSHIETLVQGSNLLPHWFHSEMSELALAVKDLLQTARKFSQVAIVTLADASWLRSTTNAYWHDYDFKELLDELDIPIYHAREYLSRADKHWLRVEQGVDAFVIAKRRAVSKCLKSLRRKTGCMPTNIISLGDSYVEHEATREIVWSMEGYALCKSVVFEAEPSMQNLRDQLDVLVPAMGRMVALQDDFDLDLMEEDDVARIRSKFVLEEEPGLS